VIPQDTINLINDTARIEEVVSDYVALKRRGANFVACCPFHNEKTPSFYVSPSKGIYKCFGCGKAGNAISFVMEQEHSSYTEALRYLARKYNIEIQEKEESAEEIARRQLGESLLLVCEFAQRFYASQLSSGEGKSVGYAYFKSRGLEDETISTFGLGWAPSSKTALMDAALAAGYKMEYLLSAGLVVEKEDGSYADKFRERVMFPIHSVSGRVIAFSGRTLRKDNPAKYVNSAETPIYIKSRNLLGIFFAKGEISRLQNCILVEGNVDMVMMHQLGLHNVVASCGTSLTIEQIRLIHKFTENITIMYDGDPAGIHAALRGIDMVLEEGLNVKIVLLPDGDDPDSFCRKHTLMEVQAFIESRQKDFIAFKTELLLADAASDPIRKANLINDIADTIAQIPDPVKRTVYVDRTAESFGIESSLLFNRITSQRQKNQGKPSWETQREPAWEEQVQQGWKPENETLAVCESDLVGFLLCHGETIMNFESDSAYYSGSEEDKPTVADFIRSALEADDTVFANSLYRKLYETYLSYYDEGYSQEEILHMMMALPDRDVANMAAILSTNKYEITVEAFENSLTTTDSWLVKFVPKAIMLYAERRLQDRIDTIRHELPGASESEQESLMREMVKLQSSQRKINQRIGREKKNR